MEKETERICLNQSVEAGAVVVRGNERKPAAEARAREGEEAERGVILEERLQQHEHNTEAAPHELGQHAAEIRIRGESAIHGRVPALSGRVPEASEPGVAGGAGKRARCIVHLLLGRSIASYARLRCIWSSTACAEASVRRVM